MTIAALLVTALLFGGMTLFSFGFAAFVLKALPEDVARGLIRRAFPHFYLFVIVAAGVAAALAVPVAPVVAGALAVVAATTVYARQSLMPAINAATDAGEGARFKRLHGASVALTLAHIGVAGWGLVRLGLLV